MYCGRKVGKLAKGLWDAFYFPSTLGNVVEASVSSRAKQQHEAVKNMEKHSQVPLIFECIANVLLAT